MKAAHKARGVRVEIAHHGEDRHQARAPIPALQGAAQAAANHSAFAQMIETAVAMLGARQRRHQLHGIEDDERSDALGNARDFSRLRAVVAPERRADADEPHQPKPRPGIQPVDAVLSDGWLGRSTHALRASMRLKRRGWIDSCDFVRGALIARGILGRGWWDRSPAAPLLSGQSVNC